MNYPTEPETMKRVETRPATSEPLPEWFMMLHEMFGELNVYDRYFYEAANCEAILTQTRYAALREMKHTEP